MVPTRRYASLLLVTASQETAAQFARLLPADRFAPEFSVCSPVEAEYVLAGSSFDVAVIDDTVPYETAPDITAAASRHGIRHVLLLTAPERFERAAGFAQQYGYMALPTPVDPALLRQSLGMMAASSERIRELEEHAQNLQEKMDELKAVDRAKLILVQQFKMSEAEAHRFIERNAMDRCVKRRVIAENIIRTYQN